jgi:hypothetical protein
MKKICSFNTSQTTTPVTIITSPQLNSCENLRAHKQFDVPTYQNDTKQQPSNPTMHSYNPKIHEQAL